MAVTLRGPYIGEWDVTIITENGDYIELMLYREKSSANGIAKPATVTSQFGPAIEADRLRMQDVAILIDGWEAGMGFSQRMSGTPRNGYSYALGAYARGGKYVMPAGKLNEVSLPAGTQTIRDSIEIPGTTHMFMIAQNRAIYLEYGAGNPATEKQFSASFTAYSVVHVNGNVYVGGTGDGIYMRNGASGAWTQSEAIDGDVRRKYLATMWSFYPQNGESVGSQKVYGVPINGGQTYTWPSASIMYVDPTNNGNAPLTEANWASEFVVGGGQYDITGLASTGQHLLALKLNGLHDINTARYTPNITPSWNGLQTDTTPHPIIVWDGYIWIGHDRGLVRVPLRGIGTNLQLDEWCYLGSPFPNESPIYGRPSALAAGPDGWLAVAIYTGSQSYICYCADRERVGIPGPGPVVWHGSETQAITGRVTHMRFASPAGYSNRPRLWIASYDGANTHLYWQDQPIYGTPLQDFLNDGGMKFQSSWSLFQTRLDWDDPDAQKDLTRVSLRGDDLGAASLEVQVAVDGSSTFTSLGSSNAAHTILGVDGINDAHDVTIKTIGTGDEDTPAILRAIKIRAGVSVETDPVIPLRVMFGPGVRTRSDRIDPRESLMVQNRLELTQGTEVTLRDHRGRNITGRIQQGMRFVDIEDSHHGPYFTLADFSVTLKEVGWFLDTGVLLDSGRVWG